MIAIVNSPAKYPVRAHLKPLSLKGISAKQIEQHWQLYEGYVKNTNDLLEELDHAQRGSRHWAELKRHLGFEFNGMVRSCSPRTGAIDRGPDGPRDRRRRWESAAGGGA